MDEYLVIHMHDIGCYVPRGSSLTEEHKDPLGGLSHSYIPKLPVLTMDISHYVPQKSGPTVEHKGSPYISQYADI
jgi:hypothetical protein